MTIALPRLRQKPSIITLADRARDAGDWEAAARLYRKALARNPRNPPIWVQYGHALKESGRLAEAEAAYRRALAYKPDEADTHLQLGHVLKMQGKSERAESSYLRGVAIDPTLSDAPSELNGMGWTLAEIRELETVSSIRSTAHHGDRSDSASAGDTKRPEVKGHLVTAPGVDLLADESLADLLTYKARARTVRSDFFDPRHLSIHWMIPDFSAGGGGHMNIFRIVQWLEVFGHTCTVWIDKELTSDEMRSRRDLVLKEYRAISAEFRTIFDGFFSASGDVLFATGWQTVAKVIHSVGFKERFYFVQDFEPSFYPMGSRYLAAESTYQHDLACICGGPWLSGLMEHRYGRWARHFWQAADPVAYFPKEHKEAVDDVIQLAIYARIGTERRAVELIYLALHELLNRGLKFHAHLFGFEPTEFHAEFPFTLHGILDSIALGALYRSCDIGVCFSSTNYSIVPQEMMACKLPVIELDLESTRAIFPPNVVTFARPHPLWIADAIAALADDPERRRKQADVAHTWVSQFSWQKSGRMVEEAILTRLNRPERKQAPTVRNLFSPRPKVSVCIPTYNGGDLLIRVLNAVRAQQTPWEVEIFVIDSTSDDGTPHVLASHRDVIFKQIPKSEFGHGKTRNMCVEHCSGEYIAFLTQDAMPADDLWLYSIVTTLESFPYAAGAFGRHLAWPHHSPFSAVDINDHFSTFKRLPVSVSRNTDKERWDTKDPSWRQQLIFFSDNNSCIRRSVWEKIPFPDVDFGEDQMWASQILEAGYEKVYAPLSVVFHSHDFDYEQCYHRSKIEAEFWLRNFGYDQYVGDEAFESRLRRMNTVAREYGITHGIPAKWIEKRYAENEARLRGQLAARLDYFQ